MPGRNSLLSRTCIILPDVLFVHASQHGCSASGSISPTAAAAYDVSTAEDAKTRYASIWQPCYGKRYSVFSM